MLLRYKTKELFPSTNLDEKQLNNSDLNKKEIDSGQTILKSWPRRIVLELTNDCNLNCIMCGRHNANFKKTSLKMEWLYKLEPILPFVEEVTLMGWGEPTVHPKFVEMLEYLNKFNVRKYFCTNGMLLGDLKEAIFENKVDIIAISLDSVSKEKNDVIRQGSNFDKILDNIRIIKTEQKKREVDYPYINFVTTIMEDNLHELPDIVRLAKDLDIEEVKVVYLTAFSEDLVDRTLYNKSEEVEKVFDESLKLADELGIDLKIPYIQGQDLAGDKYHQDCYVAWRDLFIGSDGYLRPCMSTSVKFFRFDEYDDLNDIWNNSKYVDFRKKVNTGSMDPECKSCYQSSHANWNKKKSFIQIEENFAPEWESE
jgi:radical SAM protein with 4Fe4S-binding SPASM domain